MDETSKRRLASQISQGRAILFTGAGFSRAARGRKGDPLPLPSELARRIWTVAFPGQEFEEGSDLGEVFEVALRRGRSLLQQALEEALRTDRDTLPDGYRVWFSMPWLRAYTLNMDDLDEACQAKFNLRRRVIPISAFRHELPTSTTELLSIHLNGRLTDFPDITFSPRQYAERALHPDPWHQFLASDLVSHPVVFVGTTLSEPLLWQHVELRRARTRGAQELRPHSYLVTPHLPAVKEALLQEFNVEWIPMEQEEFATTMLAELVEAAERGRLVLEELSLSTRRTVSVRDVAELRQEPPFESREFLLGREPRWADITEGYAVKRAFEEGLADLVERSPQRLVVLTGTAATGKSTTIRRMLLELQARDKHVLWLDTETELPLGRIREQIERGAPDYLGIDDLDTFGEAASTFMEGLLGGTPKLRIVSAVRSSRLDRLELETSFDDEHLLMLQVPPLEDRDIEMLIEALGRANRLGALRGLSHEARVRAFRERAGRQLLVAMLEATSGEAFEHRIDTECADLGPSKGFIYAVLSLATSLRQYLTRVEVLLAVGEANNQALNDLQELVNRHLVVQSGAELRVRHRLIADRALTHFKNEGQLAGPLKRLLFVVAARANPALPKHAREWQMLIRLLNHQFMIDLTDDEAIPREAYSEVEDLLAWDYHYWLQRGSYETEVGDMNLAKNFLEQARGLAGDDYKVQTEWAYMTIKRASLSPGAPGSRESVDEALNELDDAIRRRGPSDPYPYHVLGSQGMRWAHSASMNFEEKKGFLGRLLFTVREGLRHHPRRRDLKKLEEDIERDYLMLAVPAERRN